jgi:lactosylceramide 4-alpha-galactosyltransferase
MFFLVTSGKTKLTARQACSIESTCVNNPFMSVIVVFVAPKTQLRLEEKSPLAAVMRRWPNVRLATLNGTAAMSAAGLQNLYAKIAAGKYPRQLLSDVLRVLLLSKFGGVYSDLDLVMLQSLRSMVTAGQNFMVGDTEDCFASSFFGLQRNHPLAAG